MKDPKVVQIMPVSSTVYKDREPLYDVIGIALMDDGSIRPIIMWIDQEECLHVSVSDLAERAFKAWYEKNFPDRKPWEYAGLFINHASCMLIRKYVEKKDIDQAWLAMEADIDEYILDKILRGRAIPMQREYVSICTALRVKLTEFAIKPNERKEEWKI